MITDKIKKILFWILFVIIMVAGWIFGLTGCKTFFEPKQLPDEPMICYQSRYCLYACQRIGCKDLSGCMLNYSSPCKKIILKEYCDKLFQNEKLESKTCQLNLN